MSVEAAADLRPFAADRLLLRDALTNFLVNAAEALAERGGSVVLSAINAPLPGGAPGVRFACADDGPGRARGPRGSPLRAGVLHEGARLGDGSRRGAPDRGAARRRGVRGGRARPAGS